VVDLTGLGKGHAWVNGQSIGRYWLSYLANEDGCSPTCDYRGTYYNLEFGRENLILIELNIMIQM
jgi:hypothetical protein